MLKTTAADAADVLKSALATLPSEAEARSDFFVQWRTRTIELLERLFPQDAEPTRLFKELEFSPRRIAKNDPREDQLRLDAYLAGCAAARSLIESLIQKVAASLIRTIGPGAGRSTNPRNPDRYHTRFRCRRRHFRRKNGYA